MIKKYIEAFAKLLDQEISELWYEGILKLIEIPPENISGDFGFPCFGLAKILKKWPLVIASELVESLQIECQKIDFFSHLEAVGAYINVHVNFAVLAENVLVRVFEEKGNYGRGEKKWKIILVESPGPNTNKPLHLGHVRNLLLGNAVEIISKFAGYDVKRVDIVNDRGIHICKSMLAYQQFGNNKQPDKKSDHFVGDWYVKYAEEVKKYSDLETQIREMLLKWEDGDEEVRKLWKKMNAWALEWIAETYKRYGTQIDKAYLESDYYLKGKEKVLEAFGKWIFVKNEKWNIVFCSKDENLGDKTVLRSDWTSIYSTNDIGVAQWRFEDFAMDKMIYVVANEQADYFNILLQKIVITCLMEWFLWLLVKWKVGRVMLLMQIILLMKCMKNRKNSYKRGMLIWLKKNMMSGRKWLLWLRLNFLFWNMRWLKTLFLIRRNRFRLRVRRGLICSILMRGRVLYFVRCKLVNKPLFTSPLVKGKGGWIVGCV